MQLQNEQAGLFTDSSRFGRFIEVNFFAEVGAEQIKALLSELLVLRDDLPEHHYLQFAFGANCWDKINPAWRPADLKSFEDLTGIKDLAMPGTQADLLIWLHGHDADQLLPVQLAVYPLLDSLATIQLDLQGIKNFEGRDLIGFVDGTANPKEDKRLDAALIPAGEVGTGGSYVLSQRWQHNLDAFNALSVSAQEKVVGRTKVDDIELEGDDMPADSHVSRTDADVDGVAMKIYRKSLPYLASQLHAEEEGKPDHGLYFFAFACEMRRFEVQLERMLGIDADGICDHLMQFSKAKTGSYWFMPSETDLQNLI